MIFPYGKAPLAILIAGLLAGLAVFAFSRSAPAAADDNIPQIVFTTFVKDHAIAYAPAIAEFEKLHNCKVIVQVVDQRALQGRLQSAMQVGAAVPDMVELLDGTMGTFTMCPVDAVQFVDLTQRINLEGLYDRLVTSRFGKWSSRGHIFALPHDVHPIMLAYRRDLVEALGIDVKTLTTWEEFTRVGREIVTKDLTGDGVPDRYMIDLPADGGDVLRLLMMQRGGQIMDASDHVAFDSSEAADAVCWYVKQIQPSPQGQQPIAFPCGWGQNLAQAMNDGLCLFYICPDWRSLAFQNDVPGLKGNLGLMPLPAWTSGGNRTSTWGGTGLAFPKAGRNFNLAWKLAMYLYYDADQLGVRFEATNILPPLKAAWNEPQFDAPRPFWGGQRLGREYAALAPLVPEEHINAYTKVARDKFSQAFMDVSLHYRDHGPDGLHEKAMRELRRSADIVRQQMARNVFFNGSVAPEGEKQAAEGSQ